MVGCLNADLMPSCWEWHHFVVSDFVLYLPLFLSVSATLFFTIPLLQSFKLASSFSRHFFTYFSLSLSLPLSLFLSLPPSLSLSLSPSLSLSLLGAFVCLLHL